eukprot:UN22043
MDVCCYEDRGECGGPPPRRRHVNEMGDEDFVELTPEEIEGRRNLIAGALSAEIKEHGLGRMSILVVLML